MVQRKELQRIGAKLGINCGGEGSGVPGPCPSSGSSAVSVHPNIVEYVTRDLFKGKSVAAASKGFVKKHGNSDNVFLGGKVSVTADQVAHAIYQDKAKLAIKSMARVKPGMEEMAIGGTVDQFRFNAADEKKLREYITREKYGSNG